MGSLVLYLTVAFVCLDLLQVEYEDMINILDFYALLSL